MKDNFENIERAYKGHLKGVERKKLRDALKARKREKAAAAAMEPNRPRSRFRTIWTDQVESEFEDGTVQDHRGRRGRGTSAASLTKPAPRPDLVEFGEGIVVAVSARECTVFVEDREIPCTLAREIRSHQQSEVAVGDRAAVEVRPNGRGVVRFVHEPETVLTRPDPMIPGRVRRIASNVDAVAIVVSVIAPPLRVRLIDRILVAVERGGSRPMLLVNKIDLLPPSGEAELDRALDPYVRLGIEVCRVSATSGAGIEDLRRALSGRTILFCGHSGVGKTSLLNAIHPELRLATGEVSSFSSRGTHTTTSSRMFILPSGSRIIDSPGMRQFGIDSVDRKNLSWYFPEFNPIREGCRYSDCTHEHEPSCAVREAARNGAIAPARYETYLRILDTLR